MRSDANGFLLAMTGFFAKTTGLIDSSFAFKMCWPNTYKTSTSQDECLINTTAAQMPRSTTTITPDCGYDVAGRKFSFYEYKKTFSPTIGRNLHRNHHLAGHAQKSEHVCLILWQRAVWRQRSCTHPCPSCPVSTIAMYSPEEMTR
jgi:hypothetical protein